MARDIFHDLVKEALQKEGWVITHDPFLLHNRKEGGLLIGLSMNFILYSTVQKTLTAWKE